MYQAVDLFPLCSVLDRAILCVEISHSGHFFQFWDTADYVVILCVDADLSLDSHTGKSFDEGLQRSLVVRPVREPKGFFRLFLTMDGCRKDVSTFSLSFSLEGGICFQVYIYFPHV